MALACWIMAREASTSCYLLLPKIPARVVSHQQSGKNVETRAAKRVYAIRNFSSQEPLRKDLLDKPRGI